MAPTRSNSASDQGSRLICLLVLGVLCVGWLLAPAWPAGAPGLSSGVLALALSALIVFLAGAAALWGLLQLPAPLRRHGDATFVLATGLCGLYLLADATHLDFFGVHLGPAQLEVGLKAIAAGEVAMPWTSLGKGLGALVAWAVLCPLALRGLRRLEALAWLGAARPGLWLGVALAALLGVVAEAATFNPANTAAADVAFRVPWRAVATPAPSVNEGALTPDIELSEATEERQYLQLLARAKALIAGPVAARRRPNILVVAVESLRADAANADDMPRLHGLTRRCLSVPHYYSASNNTGSGLFGLLSGLSALYDRPSRVHGHASLPLQVLARLGYRRTAWVSKDLNTWDDIYTRLLRERIDAYRIATGPSDEARDSRMIDDLIAAWRADKAGDPPRFDFAVVYATHYQYYYPPAFEHHKPVMAPGYEIGCGMAEDQRQHADKIRNRYRNATRFVDHLIGRLVDELQRAGRWDDTVLIITGDHGEEFWEHGRFGHTYGLVDEQIRVPLAMCLPGQPETRRHYATHADVMPTVLDHLGVDFDVSTIATGRSLLQTSALRDFALVGVGLTKQRTNYDYVAIGAGLKVHLHNYGPLRATRVTDLHDQPVARPDPQLVGRLLRWTGEAKSLPDPDRGTRGTESERAEALARLPRATLIRRLVALEEESAACNAPASALWGKDARAGDVDVERLTRGAWRISWRNADGRETRADGVEFFRDGVVAPQSKRDWHRWRSQGSRLFVLDIAGHKALRATWDAAGGRLVGQGEGNAAFVATPAPPLLPRTAPTFWPPDKPVDPLTAARLTAQRWAYGWYDGRQAWVGGRQVAFLADGSIGAGHTDNWSHWRIRDGRLYVIDIHGKLFARFAHDDAMGKLVGMADSGDHLVLFALRDRPTTLIGARHWPPDAVDQPLQAATLLAQPWDYRYFLANGAQGGRRNIAFLDQGRIGTGASASWTGWRLEDGHLVTTGAKGQVSGRFRYDAARATLVGIAVDGNIMTLDAIR